MPTTKASSIDVKRTTCREGVDRRRPRRRLTAFSVGLCRDCHGKDTTAYSRTTTLWCTSSTGSCGALARCLRAGDHAFSMALCSAPSKLFAPLRPRVPRGLLALTAPARSGDNGNYMMAEVVGVSSHSWTIRKHGSDKLIIGCALWLSGRSRQVVRVESRQGTIAATWRCKRSVQPQSFRRGPRAGI
jgi:hypothetical protein